MTKPLTPRTRLAMWRLYLDNAGRDSAAALRHCGELMDANAGMLYATASNHRALRNRGLTEGQGYDTRLTDAGRAWIDEQIEADHGHAIMLSPVPIPGHGNTRMGRRLSWSWGDPDGMAQWNAWEMNSDLMFAEHIEADHAAAIAIDERPASGYDANDECVWCGAHIADPHEVGCQYGDPVVTEQPGPVWRSESRCASFNLRAPTAADPAWSAGWNGYDDAGNSVGGYMVADAFDTALAGALGEYPDREFAALMQREFTTAVLTSQGARRIAGYTGAADVTPYAVAKLNVLPTRTSLTIRVAGQPGRIVLNVLATPDTARDTSVGLMLRHAGLVPVGEWRQGSDPHQWAIDAAPHPQRCAPCFDGCACKAGTPGCGHTGCWGTDNPDAPACEFAGLVAWLPTAGPTGVYA